MKSMLAAVAVTMALAACKQPVAEVPMAQAQAAASGVAPAAVAAPLPPAVEATIRKNLAENLSGMPPVDEVKATPIAGLFEVRIGNDILYTDAQGGYVVRGDLLDLKSRRNLTEERVTKLLSTPIDFASLPLKDALVVVNGTGKRKMVVFADPNCGYCKRFERDLAKVKDVTVYTFLIPILGGDSPEKSMSIWCAKDQNEAWRAWMLDNRAPPKLLGTCAHPLERNLELQQKLAIKGTPAIFFEDGSRVPGAINAAEIEKRLAASSAKS